MNTRVLSITGGVGLAAVMLGCAAPSTGVDGASASSGELSTSGASFVVLTAPGCGPTCAGYAVQSVNAGSTPRAVGNLDFSKTTFSKSVIADITSAPLGEIVLKGALGPVQTKTHLPSFIVTEAYRGQPGARLPATASFYQGGDYDPPPPCALGTSCAEGTMTKLNTTTVSPFDTIDVSPAAATALSPDSLRGYVASSRAIVAGSLNQVRAQAVLSASQVFLQLPFVSHTPPRLAVTKAAIVDPAGNAAPLRGWNWGQWGTELASDAKDNVGQGARVVRIPLRWWGAYGGTQEISTDVDSRSTSAPGHVDPAHLALLDAMIHDASAAGLWIDLFLDSDCGQASAENDVDWYCGKIGNDPANFSNDPAMAEEFAETWEFLANRYQNQPFMGVYEVLPEPNFGTTQELTSFLSPVIDRIHRITPHMPLMIGPNGGYDIKQIESVWMDAPDLIYTGDLLKFGAKTPANVDIAADFSARKGVPVFIQQVGVLRADDGADTYLTNILDRLQADGIGWTWWTYREKAAKQTYAPFWTGGSDPYWLGRITSYFPNR